MIGLSRLNGLRRLFEQLEQPSINLRNPTNLANPINQFRVSGLQFNENTTVTVMITATGSPLSRVGVNTHWRTAVRAASLSIGLP